nr:MAG TPA: hypothetical protein [Caudoviricetes sp.]
MNDTSPVRTRDFSGWGFSFPPQPNINYQQIKK